MKLTDILLIGALALIAIALTGCFATPIKTKITTQDPLPAITYSSEKDVVFRKTSYDPATGKVIEEIELQAVASVPAAVQAERDKIQAETTAASLNLATEIIKGATRAP
jgi:hypothetical protein